MSVEIGSPQLPKLKRQKKPNDKSRDTGKKEKKRKRATSDEIEIESPTKRHKSKGQSQRDAERTLPSSSITSPVISPFCIEVASFYVPLPPITQRRPIQGLCAEHISPLILTYYPPLRGTIISYNNPRISSDPNTEASNPAYARAIDEYAASFIWLTVDVVVFKPQKGDVIEGYVNLQNESNIGLLCWNFFNASIGKKRLGIGWNWIDGGMKPSKWKLKKGGKGENTDSEDNDEERLSKEDPIDEDVQGYFEDSQGKKIEGMLRFRVKNIETSRSTDRETGFLSIEGTALNEDDETNLQEQESMRQAIIDGKQRHRNHEPKDLVSGALTNGVDGSWDVDGTPNLEHRAKF
ncbi:hypothetical protein MMC21_000610 [Puttea exsequens]|nr:hypothetical protein [Puttea exsequens]